MSTPTGLEFVPLAMQHNDFPLLTAVHQAEKSSRLCFLNYSQIYEYSHFVTPLLPSNTCAIMLLLFINCIMIFIPSIIIFTTVSIFCYNLMH